MVTLHQNLQTRLDQKLVMTPQLQLAIKLLQMPTADLQDFVQQEVLENPLLKGEDTGEGGDERGAENGADYEPLDGDSSQGDGRSGEQGWEVENGEAAADRWENSVAGEGGGEGSSGFSEGVDWDRVAAYEVTLTDHLRAQLGMATSDPTTRFIGMYLIDAIDESGYLRLELSQGALTLRLPEDRLADVLQLVQSFDPSGVGARSLAECLRLQFTHLAQTASVSKAAVAAADVVLGHLELLARGEYGKLAKLAGVAEAEIRRVCDVIRTLNPKPGLKYGGGGIVSTVVPDVVAVQDKNGVWRAELNAAALPKVLLNEDYARLTEKTAGADKSYMTERLSRAQWLVKSLEQRARTIYKVSNVLVTAQRDFFDAGPEALQPLILKDVAAKADVHESTVSRVTNGKYMETPFGVFELKYFFSSAIQTTGGQVNVAAESVKHMIKRLVAAENAHKPLSDEKLVALLQNEGVDIARRTIAKYRDELGIASSSERRVRG